MTSSWNDIIGALMDGARSANPAGQGSPSNISGGLLQNFGASPLNSPSQPGWPTPSLTSSQTPYGAVLQNIMSAMPQTRSGAMPGAIARPGYPSAVNAFMSSARTSPLSDSVYRDMGPVTPTPLPHIFKPGAPPPHAQLLRSASSDAITPSQQARPFGGVWDGFRDKITSRGFTEGMDRWGKNMAHAGDVVSLGGEGLAVAGAITGQPEVALPGAAGMAVGEGFGFLGNGMSVLSRILAGQPNAAVNAAVRAGFQQALPPMVDPPAINEKYFGS